MKEFVDADGMIANHIDFPKECTTFSEVQENMLPLASAMTGNRLFMFCMRETTDILESEKERIEVKRKLHSLSTQFFSPRNGIFIPPEFRYMFENRKDFAGVLSYAWMLFDQIEFFSSNNLTWQQYTAAKQSFRPRRYYPVYCNQYYVKDQEYYGLLLYGAKD